MHIRWMIKRDLPRVLEITRFTSPVWGEEDFIYHLRHRNVIGMVVEYEDSIVGFMVYRLNKNRIKLLNIGVHPTHRRLGCGTTLIDKLKGKMVRRPTFYTEVPDDNLDLHLFLKAQGFTASVLTDELYRFTYQTQPILS